MTGALKGASSSAITAAASDEDDERMKRSRWFFTISCVARRAQQDRLMHGRHAGVPGRVHFVHPAEEIERVEPGVQHTSPPADSGASSPAIRPWM